MSRWSIAALGVVALGLVLRLGVAVSQPLGPAEAALAWPGVAWLEGGTFPSAAPAASVLGGLGTVGLGFFDLAPRLPGILLAAGVLAAFALSARPAFRWIAVLGALSPVLVLAQGTVSAGGIAAGLVLLWWLLAWTGRPAWVAAVPAGALLALGLPGLAGLAVGGIVLLDRFRPGRAVLGGAGAALATWLVLATGLGASPSWLGSLVPAPGPVAWDGAVMLVLAYLPAVLVLWVLGWRQAGNRRWTWLAAVLAAAVALVLPDGLATAPILAVAVLPGAAVGVAWLVRQPVAWSWWLLLPLAFLVFAAIAGNWIARNPAPDPFLVMAGVAGLILPVLLLVALVVFGRIRGATAVAAMLVVLVVVEVRAISTGGFGDAPDLVIRDRGTPAAARTLVVLESPRFAATRLLPDPADAQLQWWARQRTNPARVSTDPALLALSTRPEVTEPVMSDVAALTWDGRFAGAGAAVRWFLAREGVLPLPRSVYLRRA